MIVAKANGFTDPSFIPNLGSSANGVASVVEFNPDLTNGVEINEEMCIRDRCWPMPATL